MKILIIDDDNNIANSIAWVLAAQGHQPQTAASGEEGLAYLSSQSVDLIFLDVVMPGIGGLATLEKITALFAQIPVIMISGQADITLAVQATRLGAYDFLEKPLSPEKILLEIKNLNEQLTAQAELSRLKEWVEDERQMIGHAPAMQELRRALDRAAPTDSRILIWGENGAGKEVVARLIHEKSLRRDQPFLQLNCAAIPRELLESELFGYEKGAFTGAYQRKIGFIERAQGGTLLLDEIGDMAADTQAKLLRVLQENEFTRVGATAPIRFDVRILSATNKDLEQLVAVGAFRQDLFFRLNVIPIRVPPLRERAVDIAELCRHFLYLYCRRNGKKQKRLHSDAEKLLRDYSWPGNVRELRNIMERLAIMIDAEEIDHAAVLSVLPQFPQAPAVGSMPEELSLKEHLNLYEKKLLSDGLATCAGNISRLAAMLQTDRANLYKKLRQYGLIK